MVGGSMIAILRYANPLEIAILFVSSICAIGGGAGLPFMGLIFGRLAGVFQKHHIGVVSSAELSDQVVRIVLYFIYLAVGEFFAVYISTIGFIYAGERISGRLRERLLHACLRQDMSFHDQTSAGEITTRITADTNLIQDGISEKVGLILAALASFAAAMIVGFVTYWKLTLILSSMAIMIVAIMFFSSKWIVKYAVKTFEAYEPGGALAEEVFSSVRDPTAFGTQEMLADQYREYLDEAAIYGGKMKTILGVMVGAIFLVMYLGYGLAFWVGSYYLIRGQTTLQKILTILFAIMTGTFSLGNVSSNFQAISTGMSAAVHIFDIIERKSHIDSLSTEGSKLTAVDGEIKLTKVTLCYPSRADIPVISNLDLVVPSGKRTAIVGTSGSGKTSVINLVERFYSPTSGQVLLDGHDISCLNVRWLRQQISLVGQEPVLFSTSIYENIRYGLVGSKFEDEYPEKTTQRVMDAATLANAHDFVSALPKSYHTEVGERGLMLSGGQRQRIAIARAIISNPKILLLDEATSALDVRSEGVVQAALDAASIGRTTIIVTHRLTTIRNADNIVVMEKGRVVEQGTHNQLLEKKAAYFNLVEAQELKELHAVSGTGDSSIVQSVNPHSEEGVRGDAKDECSSFQPAASLPDSLPADDSQPSSLWNLIAMVISLNNSEWRWMLMGLFWSIICGAGSPVSSVFVAKSIVALSAYVPTINRYETNRELSFWSLMYLMLGIVQGTAFVAEGYAFAYCSERLVHRVRDKAFRSILRQDVVYFDKTSSGALTAFLATETADVAGLSGVTLGTILNVCTTLIGSLLLSLVVGWKLALVTASAIPMLLGCGYLRFAVLAALSSRKKQASAASASYACEAISAIKTVTSLTREQSILLQYRASLDMQLRETVRSVVGSAALYAASQSITYLCMALGFWYGGTLISRGEYSLLQFYICFAAIIFGAQSAGTIFAFAPDMGKAKGSASELKRLFDRQPSIDSWSDEGEMTQNIDGLITILGCWFTYPTRPGVPVLQDLNLTVRPGHFVALVGASGSGKSTVISLIQRFYDLERGTISVDGRNIRTLHLQNYRSFLALVPQEATLYHGSIRENILFGTTRMVTDEEIVTACQEANIYDFIISLPAGFSTVVGNKGSLLSGGQKQRIAIARALLRQPRILLLDEATSALDTESERVVQKSINKAAKGRTTICVAHRLSTIQHADIIHVLNKGRIVESGTHAELTKRGGLYCKLAQLQAL